MSKQRPPQGSGPATVTALIRDESGPLELARALADASREAMMLVDQNGVVLHANPASIAIFSPDKSDLRGREVRVLVPGCPSEFRSEEEERSWTTRVLLATEGVIELDIRLRALDPPRRSLLCLVAVRIDAQAVEAAQRADVERWALAAQGSTDGFWHRPDVGVDAAWWSPRLYEMLGLPADSVPCFSALVSRLHPEDREVFLDERASSLLLGKSFDTEVRLRHESGKYRQYRVRALVTKERDGRPLALSGSLQDVTALREARDALEANQARIRDMAAAASDFFFEMDEALKITWLSENFTQVTGIDRDQVIGPGRQRAPARRNARR